MKSPCFRIISGILVLLAITLAYLAYAMFRDLPHVAASFFILLIIPVLFVFSVALAWLIPAFKHESQRLAAGSVLMLVMTALMAVFLFPPDLRTVLQVNISRGFEGNIYYFRKEGGNTINSVDAQGFLFISEKQAKNKRLVLKYGDYLFNEQDLRGKVSLNFFESEQGETLPFGSFHIAQEGDHVLIEASKSPLDSLKAMKARGVLPQGL